MAISVNIGPVLCQGSCFLQQHVNAAERWWMVKNHTLHLFFLHLSALLLTLYLCLSYTHTHLLTEGHESFRGLAWSAHHGLKLSQGWLFPVRYLHSSWKQQGRASKLMQYALCPIYISSGETVIKAACILRMAHATTVPHSSRVHHAEITITLVSSSLAHSLHLICLFI